MKFLNLNTGYSFDALWTGDQEKGYIFWFPKEQSVGLTYTMPIAIVTESNPNEEPEKLTLTIEENDIFSFIESTNIETCIDGYVFNGEPVYSKTITTNPVAVNEVPTNTKYVHIFNVACRAENVNEYICKIVIDKYGYIRVGADFYGEYEPAYINLSNMGVELPLSIQKAVYDSNVHEDLTDNILINRKFKELLSNYWDIVANKGSYKSLLNSLEWFEWGNKLKMHEIYRRNEADNLFFNDKNLVASINEQIETTFNNFVKTTYISLYCDIYNETPNYDSEHNPILENIVFDWALNDIKLKLSLLAKYLGTYFLPIHISLLHATVESKVFTNTIKIIHNGEINRIDQFADFDYVKCNIKETDTFGIVNVQLEKDTNTFYITSDEFYNGPGALIPIELTISNRYQSEFVKQTIIDYIDEFNEHKLYKCNNVFNAKFNNDNDRYEIPMQFILLVKRPKQYELNFTFILSSSKTLSKKVLINVKDIDNLNINLYRVQAKDDKIGFSRDDFYSEGCSKYFFRIQPHTDNVLNQYYTNYLPYLGTSYWDNEDYTGIKLNKTIVLQTLGTTKFNDSTVYTDTIGSALVNDNFLYFCKTNSTNEVTYLTFVSKKFCDETSSNALLKSINNVVFGTDADGDIIIKQAESTEKNNSKAFKVIRNEYGFYPQFHTIKELEGNTIEDYTIKPYEAICAAAEISMGSEVIPFRYGHLITDIEWSFYNHLTNENINLPQSVSSQQPFIADNNKLLSPGYYDITFKYKLGNETKKCNLDSAFRIKAD
jgi:hypothetical protein